jgi:hypothetical protein
MTGLLKKLLGSEKDKPIEKPQIEVVASHHFMCKGLDKSGNLNYESTIDYPITQIIFSDGSTKVTCPCNPTDITDYCTALVGPANAPLCPYGRKETPLKKD